MDTSEGVSVGTKLTTSRRGNLVGRTFTPPPPTSVGTGTRGTTSDETLGRVSYHSNCKMVLE